MLSVLLGDSIMATKITLDKVKDQFDHWRRSRKNKKTKIPESLWRSAISLSKDYPVSKIITTLGLAGSAFAKNKSLYSNPDIQKKTIKKAAHEINENTCFLTGVPEHTRKSKSLNPFIQIPIRQPEIHSVSHRTTTITLQRGGIQLSLNSPSVEQVQWIINTLLR
jgi:hypothetical protein